MKGRPLAIKCPKCRLGQHGRPKQHLGVERTPGMATRETMRAGHSRRGAVVRTLTHMTCHDCGHAWWTTLKGPVQ